MAVRADDVDLGRDRALVERFQSGDEAGFEDLYRRYYGRLYRFCLRRTGNAHDAEELTQEAFARAYRAMPALGGERRFYPWLSVIASRLCIDSHRRSTRSEPVAEVDLGGVDGGQVDHVLALHDREVLAQALERLGPRHREVLRLREEQGWSYQRIAAFYGVSLGTVEQLLFRARKALRREFTALSGTEKLAGLPVVGWLARRMAGWRARFEDALAQHLPAVSATAMAATMAVVSATAPALAPEPETVLEGLPASDTVIHDHPAPPPTPDAADHVEAVPPPAPETSAPTVGGGTGAAPPPPVIGISRDTSRDPDAEVAADSSVVAIDASPGHVLEKLVSYLTVEASP